MYRDRAHAGDVLAQCLVCKVSGRSPVVMGIPRGGVVVADRVADALSAPLDVVAARKIALPGNPEYGVGAVDPEGNLYISPRLPERLDPDYLCNQTHKLSSELADALRTFRAGRPEIDVRRKTVVVVDDGLATGVTARAALEYLRKKGASQLILAVPVAPRDAVEEMSQYACHVVCPLIVDRFYAVGQWYDDFSQVTEAEVIAILKSHRPEG